MIWLHNSEIKTDHVVAHIPMGMSFESIGLAADIRQVREATRSQLPISGNLDPISVLWQGNPEENMSAYMEMAIKLAEY